MYSCLTGNSITVPSISPITLTTRLIEQIQVTQKSQFKVATDLLFGLDSCGPKECSVAGSNLIKLVGESFIAQAVPSTDPNYNTAGTFTSTISCFL